MFNYHPTLFTPGWPVFPYNGCPVYPVGGPEAAILRRIVRQTYPKRMFKRLKSVSLGADDSWVLSVSCWLRRLKKIRLQLRDKPSLIAVSDLRLFQMLKCAPGGYKLANPKNRAHRYCQQLACPFCYARRVGQFYRPLRAAANLVPTGTPVYYARLTVKGTRADLVKALRRRRVAAATAVSLPGLTPSIWFHRVVVLSDDPARLDKLGPVRPVKGAKSLVIALANTLGYPPWWRGTKGIARALAVLNLTHGMKSVVRGRQGLHAFASYGAARKDYVPGKGVLDFLANEPKG